MFDKEKLKESQRKYRESKKGKIKYKQAQDKYNKSEKGKLSRNNATKKYKRNNPEKIKTENKLKYLLEYGNINNSDFLCAICGKQPVEKHHENYDEPYVFIPLCIKHHNKIHNGEFK